jgi:hypothetical protein
MKRIEASEPKAKDKARKSARGDDPEPPAGGPPRKAESQPRVSTTDAEVRVMKMADGGYTELEAIEELIRRGTRPLMPPPKSKDPSVDAFAPKPGDSEALAQWRRHMASDEGKERYQLRAASVVCVDPHVRRRGLTQFRVQGLLDVVAYPFVTELQVVLKENPADGWQRYDHRLKIGGVKITIDGSVQGRTSAFNAPHLTAGTGGQGGLRPERAAQPSCRR